MKRTTGGMRVIVVLSLLAIAGSFLTAPGVFERAAMASELVPSAGRTAPKPPPIPVGPDGQRLQGSWAGPYSFRVVHSGKCLDMNSAADGGLAVQHQCLGSWASQAWYLWQTRGDGSVAYFLFGNGYTGKCIEPIPWSRGASVQGWPCATLGNQDWGRTASNTNLYFNWTTQFCFEVGGWAGHDGAPVIQWDCLGNNNQTWLQYNWT